MPRLGLESYARLAAIAATAEAPAFISFEYILKLNTSLG